MWKFDLLVNNRVSSQEIITISLILANKSTIHELNVFLWCQIIAVTQNRAK